MRKLILLFSFFTLFTFYTTNAQTIGGSILIGVPQGEFYDNIERLGYGLQFQGTLYTPGPETPFTVGLNFGFMIYGEDSQRSRLSPGIPVNVDVNTTNSLVNFHLLFQVSPFNYKVKPYFEGLFGGAYIYTKTSVESLSSSEDIFSEVNFDDFTWSYGVGGGFLILLTDEMGNDGNSSLYLDIKARYIFGSNAEYLTEGSIEVTPTEVIYYYSESKTDVLSINAGVTFSF